LALRLYFLSRRDILNIMDFPVLQTKLYIPQARTDLVRRPRLLDRLDEGTRRKWKEIMVDTKTFKRPAGTIAYDDVQGGGELVMMWPGMGALRSEYRYLAPELAKAGYRVVTADLRGHGESSVDWPEYSLPAVGQDILALIDHLDKGPAHVIGTSFSPGAAVWAAAERPEAFRSLTLIGAFVRDPQPSLMQNLTVGLLLRGPWKVQAWAMYYKTLYPTRLPSDFDAYIAQLKTNLKEPGRFDALKGLGFSPKTASEQRLSKVKTPALVVMGTKDPDWPDPQAEAQFIAEALSAELVMVEGAGHYPQTEMPEQTTPAILDFLRQVNGSRA
jgi:pimeloyl-ACP methyl ester carboxylesterase